MNLLLWNLGAGVLGGCLCLGPGVSRDLVAGWMLPGTATGISWFAMCCSIEPGYIFDHVMSVC